MHFAKRPFALRTLCAPLFWRKSVRRNLRHRWEAGDVGTSISFDLVFSPAPLFFPGRTGRAPRAENDLRLLLPSGLTHSVCPAISVKATSAQKANTKRRIIDLCTEPLRSPRKNGSAWMKQVSGLRELFKPARSGYESSPVHVRTSSRRDSGAHLFQLLRDRVQLKQARRK